MANHFPLTTYRLQFNAEFTFEHAKERVAYLADLGVTHVYASPLMQARPGSAHGYDVADPRHINPELGGEPAFNELSRELRARGLSILLDIVPNHMAVGAENPWWRDVMFRGPRSPYAWWFDIDWYAEGAEVRPQVLTPQLGVPYAQALAEKQLSLALEERGFQIRYFEHAFPVGLHSYPRIFNWIRAAAVERPGAATLERDLDAIVTEVRDLLGRLENRLSGIPDSDEDRAAIDKAIATVWNRVHDSPELAALVDEECRKFGEGDEEGPPFTRIDAVIAEQNYRLGYWRIAPLEMNYRRFFNIAELAGIRVERDDVFETTHQEILRLIREGHVTGLRIDHIDGLYDPQLYLEKLDAAVRRALESKNDIDAATPTSLESISEAEQRGRPYVLVEKILSGHERLPETWPIAGTTGYEFLNHVNSVFVASRGYDRLEQIYREFTGARITFEDTVYRTKKHVLAVHFQAELQRLTRDLKVLALSCAAGRDLTSRDLRDALEEVTVVMSVYRAYVRGDEVRAEDRAVIERALSEAVERAPDLDPRTVDFLRGVLVHRPGMFEPELEARRLEFVMRWQQFTGPLMAKGLEDTALYNYNPIVSLNEVGGEPPENADRSLADFHAANVERAEKWPHALSTTATHDTKRGEDVRARINVLSEIPELWQRRLNRWHRWNAAKKMNLRGEPMPPKSAEILLYQTLLGAWPMRSDEWPDFIDRIGAYMLKAAREAKTHTSWIESDEEYERLLQEFVRQILAEGADNRFFADFLRFQRRVAYWGALNSLAQVVLKTMSPGVPDFYQGTELFDFSLVDPDNRRPVNYEERRELLRILGKAAEKRPRRLCRELLASWPDGRIKFFVTMRCMTLRRQLPELFREGDYLPLEVEGERANHVCAFARRRGEQWVVIAVPRFVSRLARALSPPLGERVWKETAISLPEGAPAEWRNVFTEEKQVAAGTEGGTAKVRLAEAFGRFPVAVLTAGE